MKAAVERIEGNFAHLAIEVEEPQVQRALDEGFRRLVQRVNVPGFRRGRVPRPVLERRIGKGALYEEALKTLIPRAYADAVRETGIDPIDEPEFDVQEVDDGRPLKFTARVLVRPQVKLPDYRSIRVEKRAPRVEDEEVDRYLRTLQQNRSTAVPADHDRVRDGDLVTLDMQLVSDGETLEIRDGGRDLTIEVGARQDLPGLGEGLVGLAVGDEKDIETTLPSDFRDKERAGKPARAHVKVKAIRERRVPALDDEFAKAVGGYESLEAMRQDVRDRLQRAAEGRADADYRKSVIDRVTSESEVDVPEVLVDREVDRMMRGLANGLAQQGLTLDAYLEACGMDRDALRRDYRAEAYSTVKSELVLHAIGKAEGFVATSGEVDEKVAEIAEREQRSVDEVRELLSKTGRIEDVEAMIVREKAIEHLVRLAAGE